MTWIRLIAVPLFAAALALAATANPSMGQSSMEDAVRQLNSGNAKGYLQPLADLFSADMSGGWYRSARVGPDFSASVELVASMSKVGENQRTYTAVAPAGFNPPTFETATVFGGAGTEIQGPNGTSFRGSDGVFAADYLPTIVPQLRVGLAGTEVIIRYFSSSLLPSFPIDGFPETRLLGLGGRHSISQYVEAFPLDVSVGLFFTKVRIGGEGVQGAAVHYTAVGAGLQASKTIAFLTIFAGAASDGGEMNLEYQSTSPDAPGSVSVGLDVPRRMRFTTGAAIGFGGLRVAGEASFGRVAAFSGGLRFGI